MSLKTLDLKIIGFFKRAFIPVARFGMFVIFFWFGVLKVLELSPASGVVQRLFESTVPFMAFDTFLILFGLFECLIGILFLVKGAERVVIPMLFIHMVTTFGPLVLLPGETWTSTMVPTLEGQYIIKNLVIIATAIGIAANVRPFRS